MVTFVKWDGKFTVEYLLDNGQASAFRVDPAMGALIEQAVNSRTNLILALEKLSKLSAAALKEFPGEIIGIKIPVKDLREALIALAEAKAIEKPRGS